MFRFLLTNDPIFIFCKENIIHQQLRRVVRLPEKGVCILLLLALDATVTYFGYLWTTSFIDILLVLWRNEMLGREGSKRERPRTA